MIHLSTLDFLNGLAANNTKDWFESNRPAYEAARQNIIDLAATLIDGISLFDGAVATNAPEPKKCISRIHRDVRFSKNKSPYKTNFFILIRHNAAKKEDGTGYYVQIQPGDVSFCGCGVYMPMPPDLHRLRTVIETDYDVWREIVEAKPFRKQFPDGVRAFDALRNVPRGFDRDSPAADYLKMKGYHTEIPLADRTLQSASLSKSILDGFRTGYPMLAFLQRAMG
ncbi:MAG: DUF2461 domain-containing protein [Candidatus Kapabacteria bacterium]|nr:DUF2461 domain-containing protein [Candidatus Kapabacteria bacterium]